MASIDIAKAAKAAFEQSQLVSNEDRIKALRAIRQQLETQKDSIISANLEDLKVR